MLEPTALSPTDILLDRSDAAVAVVTINRHKRRNAMTLAIWNELGRIFASLNADRDARAAILTGAGEVACSTSAPIGHIELIA